MKLQIELEKIVDNPRCKIRLNGLELYSGDVMERFEFEHDATTGPMLIEIEHWDKKPEDTVVESDIIVRDRSFQLKKITVDDIDLEELIWHSEFRANDGKVYPSCLFFGPNGCFVLELELPALRWILKKRHEKNNNDPTWDEDYEYYIQACKILKQISDK